MMALKFWNRRSEEGNPLSTAGSSSSRGISSSSSRGSSSSSSRGSSGSISIGGNSFLSSPSRQPLSLPSSSSSSPPHATSATPSQHHHQQQQQFTPSPLQSPRSETSRGNWGSSSPQTSTSSRPAAATGITSPPASSSSSSTSPSLSHAALPPPSSPRPPISPRPAAGNAAPRRKPNLFSQSKSTDTSHATSTANSSSLSHAPCSSPSPVRPPLSPPQEIFIALRERSASVDFDSAVHLASCFSSTSSSPAQSHQLPLDSPKVQIVPPPPSDSAIDDSSNANSNVSNGNGNSSGGELFPPSSSSSNPRPDQNSSPPSPPLRSSIAESPRPSSHLPHLQPFQISPAHAHALASPKPAAMSPKASAGGKEASPKQHPLVASLGQQKAARLKSFSYAELKSATKNFSKENLLGEGGFGRVYRGSIPLIALASGEGHAASSKSPKGGEQVAVAVKKLNKNSIQGDKEWLAEVNVLSNLSHDRLVKLLGYCAEDNDRLLVYEVMSKGSLDTHLHNTSLAKELTWLRRVQIAVDAAKGLAHLHHEIEHPLIFRDLKTANILLDHSMRAKLSDFGMARAGPEGDVTHVSTQVVGTKGYAAPEYVLTGHLTLFSDVWSFGVVLLELMTGKRAADDSWKGEEGLVEWAMPLLRESRRLFRIMDPNLEGRYSVKAAQRMAQLALECLSRNGKQRPIMSQVVARLEPLLDMADVVCNSPSTTPSSRLSTPRSRMDPSSPSSSADRRDAASATGLPENTVAMPTFSHRRRGPSLSFDSGTRAHVKPPQLPAGKQTSALVAALRERSSEKNSSVRERANAGRVTPLAINVARVRGVAREASTEGPATK